jgi:metal-sulfur cluster biosynthetic enzyme
MLTEQAVIQALHQVIDSEHGRNLVELGMVKQTRITAGEIRLKLALTTSRSPRRGQ